MPVELVVQDSLQIVVPVRLARAVTGAPRINNPDIDDRGWLMNRPAGLASTTARGPMFGMTAGSVVTIKLVREDIDGDTPLYVNAESVGNPQFSIESPTSGLLPPDGTFRVRAVADTSDGQKLFIRLGAVDGPILYEAEPHVFSALTLNVQPHICTIHSAASAPGTGVAPRVNGAAIDINRLRDGVNAVWQPAGVRFNFAAVRNETYFNYVRNDFARWANSAAVGNEGHLVATNHVANQCNVYFIRYMQDSLGVGVNRDTIASEGWTQPGIIVGVEGSQNAAGTTTSTRSSTGAALYQELINDLAHELGHYLSLQHVDNRNSPGRDDTFTRRCLMHPNNLMPGPSGTNNVRADDAGYGTGGSGSGHRGCLITLKQLPNIGTDSETIRGRRRFRSPNLY